MDFRIFIHFLVRLAFRPSGGAPNGPQLAEANRSICGQINSAGCMVLDDGKFGHYDYRLHVTGYDEIRDDFLSSIEKNEANTCSWCASAGYTTAATTTQWHEANTHIHGRYEHFGEFPGFSRVTVYPRTLVDPTRNKRTVSGMGRFLAGNGAELWGDRTSTSRIWNGRIFWWNLRTKQRRRTTKKNDAGTRFRVSLYRYMEQQLGIFYEIHVRHVKVEPARSIVKAGAVAGGVLYD
jgi:hypothetical protein